MVRKRPSGRFFVVQLSNLPGTKQENLLFLILKGTTRFYTKICNNTLFLDLAGMINGGEMMFPYSCLRRHDKKKGGGRTAGKILIKFFMFCDNAVKKPRAYARGLTSKKIKIPQTGDFFNNPAN